MFASSYQFSIGKSGLLSLLNPLRQRTAADQVTMQGIEIGMDLERRRLGANTYLVVFWFTRLRGNELRSQLYLDNAFPYLGAALNYANSYETWQLIKEKFSLDVAVVGCAAEWQARFGALNLLPIREAGTVRLQYQKSRKFNHDQYGDVAASVNVLGPFASCIVDHELLTALSGSREQLARYLRGVSRDCPPAELLLT